MTVYVVCGGWSYEGWDKPVGVYSTKEKAEAARVDTYKRYRRHDFVDVFECELDVSTGIAFATTETTNGPHDA